MTNIDPLHRNQAAEPELNSPPAVMTPFGRAVQRALRQGSRCVESGLSIYCRSCGRLLHSDGERRFGLCDEHRCGGDEHE